MNWLRDEHDSALIVMGVCLAYIASLVSPVFGIIRAVAGSLVLSYLLGHSLRCLVRLAYGTHGLTRLWTPAGVALDLLSSLMLTFVIAIALMLTFTFEERFFIPLILGITIGSSLAVLRAAQRRPSQVTSPPRIRPDTLFALAFLGAFSIAIFVLLRLPTPYPSVTGWDLNPMAAIVGWTLDHHGFGHLLIPPFPAEYFLPYPASLPQAVASYALFLGVPPVAIFYYGVLPAIFLYCAGIFGVAHKLSGRVAPSLVASLVAVFLGVTNLESVRSPFYLTVDLMAQLFFLGVLLFYLDDEHGAARRRGIVLVTSAFLLYLYYYAVLVVAPFLVFMITEPTTGPDGGIQEKWFRRALFITLYGVTAGIMLAAVTLPDPDSFLYAPLPLLPKALTLNAIYTVAFLPLLAIAAIAEWKSREARKVRGIGFRHFAEYSIIYGVIYFLPFWMTFRVEFYIRLALALFIASIPLLTWNELKRILGRQRARISGNHKRIPAGLRRPQIQFAVVFIVVAFMVVSIPGYFRLPDAYMSEGEYQGALWIKTNTPTDAYLVTDTGTGYVLRGFALRNASTFFILPDGRVPAESSTLYPNLQNKLHDIFTSASTQEAAFRVTALGFQKTFVVVSTRTVVWSSEAATAIYAHPFPGISFDGLLRIFAPPTFVPEYQSTAMYVFSVHP